MNEIANKRMDVLDALSYGYIGFNEYNNMIFFVTQGFRKITSNDVEGYAFISYYLPKTSIPSLLFRRQ